MLNDVGDLLNWFGKFDVCALMASRSVSVRVGNRDTQFRLGIPTAVRIESFVEQLLSPDSCPAKALDTANSSFVKACA
jgi:hypothetical protein